MDYDLWDEYSEMNEDSYWCETSDCDDPYDDELIELYNEIQGLEAVIESIGYYPDNPDAFHAREQAKQDLEEVRSRYEYLQNL